MGDYLLLAIFWLIGILHSFINWVIYVTKMITLFWAIFPEMGKRLILLNWPSFVMGYLYIGRILGIL